MRPKGIAVVGGGVTGLTAAYYLERDSSCEIELFEPDRLGGKVGTSRIGELLVEDAADCFYSSKPDALELVEDLGLAAKLIKPRHKRFFMLVDGQLHPVPSGLLGLGSVDAGIVDQAQFLSREGKAKAKSGPGDMPDGDEDESIASFFTRRYGREFADRVAAPLLAGTHGGSAKELSMKALYPAYLGQNDSSKPQLSSAGKPGFFSFREGMEELPKALSNSLKRASIRKERATLQDVAKADRVLFAVPAPALAEIIGDAYPNLGALLRRIEHKPATIATFAFDREHVCHDLQGTGFLVPEGESTVLTGCSWSSEKWEGRASAGQVLLRAFLRPGRGNNAESDALLALRPILGLRGDPVFSRTLTLPNALPQYKLGHLDLMSALLMALPPAWIVAGTSYQGVGIPDCVRQGKQAAKKIAEDLE